MKSRAIRSVSLYLALPLATAVAGGAPRVKLDFKSAEQFVGQPVTIQQVSDDGKVFAGVARVGGKRIVFRYTEKEGYQDVSAIAPPGLVGMDAYGISQDGETIFGEFEQNVGGTFTREGFAWSVKDGFQEVGHLPGESFSVTTVASPNGKTLAGTAGEDGPSRCFLWSKQEGIQAFSSLYPDFPEQAERPFWISNNRHTVWAQTDDNKVLRWVQGRGTVTYDEPPDGHDLVFINAVTRNGKVGFGSTVTPEGLQAVSFLRNGSMVRLLPDIEVQTQALFTFAKDRMVGGYLDEEHFPAGSFSADDSFFFDRVTGKMSLFSELIEGQSKEMEGWTRLLVLGISKDGNTMIGFGTDPKEEFVTWVLKGAKTLVVPKRPLILVPRN